MKNKITIIILTVLLMFSISNLMFAATYEKEYLQAIEDNELDKVKKLVESGKVSIHKFEKYDSFPLSYACWKNSYKIAAYLILQGADVNQKGSSGGMALATLMEYCTRHNNTEKDVFPLVKLFLKKGARLNYRGKYFSYPLIIAASHNHMKIVKLFLAHGAKRDIVGRFGYTPASVAALEGHLEMAYFISGKGIAAYRRTLFYAAQTGNVVAMRRILRNSGSNARALVRKKDLWAQNTALHLAAAKGHLHAAQLLVSYGAKIDAWNKSRTPLLEAVAHLANATPKHYKVMENVALFLVGKGANLNASQKSGCAAGFTPFLWAVQESSYKLVKAMWATGRAKANVRGRSAYGFTPAVMKMIRVLWEDCKIQPSKAFLREVQKSRYSNKFCRERYKYFKEQGLL